ncbi:hypothetical protein [Halomicrococcus sp. NG-SE-24]|uniref:hypothetical protein n=1 Tax=Halomicrococcus sp. NG-SE-24 TaxID=3436928 RepID=UPI003D9933AD
MSEVKVLTVVPVSHAMPMVRSGESTLRELRNGVVPEQFWFARPQKLSSDLPLSQKISDEVSPLLITRESLFFGMP